MINILYRAVKSIIMISMTSYTFFKIMNFKVNRKKHIGIICSLIIADFLLKFILNTITVLLLEIVIQTFIFALILKRDLMDCVVGVMIANVLTYVMFIFSTIIEYRCSIIIRNTVVIIDVIFSAIIQFILTIGLFKIRKFKNGLPFLQNKKSNEYMNFIIISICASLILIYCLLVSYFASYNKETGKMIYFSFMIIIFFMVLMIQKTLTIAYKQKLIEQTLKDYETQLKEKDEKLKSLEDEKYRISKLNHEFHNRQKALMLKVDSVLSGMDVEADEEFGDLRDRIKSLSDEFSRKQSENKILANLSKTGIEEIDDMFTYMAKECIDNKIEFVLQVNGNINYLVNNIIDKSRLVTLIGDHLRDSIIAVNYSKNEYRSIMAVLGIKDDNYEFAVYDSGIEFEIHTLEKLGLEPASTHSDSGGTGIGFITTFETLKETKASFILEELGKEDSGAYTKVLRFVFDEKERMEIISYRKDVLKDKLNSRRFIVS